MAVPPGRLQGLEWPGGGHAQHLERAGLRSRAGRRRGGGYADPRDAVMLVRSGFAALAAGLLFLSPIGPYSIKLLPGDATPNARGTARLLPNGSPFGIGVAADGRASYAVRISAAQLPRPADLGRFTT